MRKLVKQLLYLPSWFRVIPCQYKNPLLENWQETSFSNRELAQIIINNEFWYVNQITGIGLLLGHYPQGYLIAIDCDSPTAIAFYNSLNLPPSLSFSSGVKYKKQVLYFLEQYIPNRYFNELKIEIRGKRLQSILPPSIHPENREYVWIDRLPIAQITSETILNSFPQKSQNQQKSPENYSFQDAEKARWLLQRIDPAWGKDYWNWIAIGMALRNISSNLLQDWDKWSSHAPKYKPLECRYKWQSFKQNARGYSIKTLWHFYLLTNNFNYRNKYESKHRNSKITPYLTSFK